MKRLLLIGDDNGLLDRFVQSKGNEYDLTSTQSLSKAFEVIQGQRIDAIFFDIDTHDTCDLGNLQEVCVKSPVNSNVYVFSRSSDLETAVKAIKAGASDFFLKTEDYDRFVARITNLLGSVPVNGLESHQKSAIDDHHDRMVFASKAMKKIYIELNRLANSSVDCLLVGETGVGKDLIATEVHKRSSRRDRPFISVPVGSFSHTLLESELFGHEKGAFSGADRRKIGKFEAADGGTVYIPEISELSKDIQLKLLHFLQYKSLHRVGQDARQDEIRVDVRLIMATNERLDELVKQGRMRKDFYYRISAVRIEVPPLRERPEDIEPLAKYFLQRFTEGYFENRYEFDPAVLKVFRQHPWYGNVREMRNLIERAAISLLFNAPRSKDPYFVTLDYFPDLTKSQPTGNAAVSKQIETRLLQYKKALEDFKRGYFNSLLNQTEGKISEAAKIAGITPQAIRKIVSQLQLK